MLPIFTVIFFVLVVIGILGAYYQVKGSYSNPRELDLGNKLLSVAIVGIVLLTLGLVITY